MPRFVPIKSMLNKTRRRDPWFMDDYTINPFSGCSYNCLYCYIRGSKYGERMEEKLAVKENALPVLEKQLAGRAKKGQHGIIVLASATEPYLPFEKELNLTREILKLILKYQFPVHIITKSNLVTRDFDLLKEINQQGILSPDLQEKTNQKVFITFSFSSLDDEVNKIFEPGSLAPTLRLQTLQQTIHAGFHTGVSLMPLIPLITDTTQEIERFYATFRKLGVHYLFPASMTLFGTGPSDSRALMFRAIEKYFPDKIEAYEQFFAYGSPIDWHYKQELSKRFRSAREKYPIPESILNP